MNKVFLKALEFVLAVEGGYSNHKNDAGGETNFGITSAVYLNYLKRKNLPDKSVRFISTDEVKEIYYYNYFIPSSAGIISDAALAAVVFDTAVNMGVYRAKKFLTLSGGNLSKYLELRRLKYLEFAKINPSQACFLAGWMNRLDKLEKFITSL